MNSYEGDAKVKKVKLQTLRREYELMEMKNDDKEVAYFTRLVILKKKNMLLLDSRRVRMTRKSGPIGKEKASLKTILNPLIVEEDGMRTVNARRIPSIRSSNVTILRIFDTVEECCFVKGKKL